MTKTAILKETNTNNLSDNYCMVRRFIGGKNKFFIRWRCPGCGVMRGVAIYNNGTNSDRTPQKELFYRESAILLSVDDYKFIPEKFCPVCEDF